ncbi:MAG: hypothetical protein PXY39_08370, partial [archaeon]|nr:hypothetical protein [archaeon]
VGYFTGIFVGGIVGSFFEFLARIDPMIFGSSLYLLFYGITAAAYGAFGFLKLDGWKRKQRSKNAQLNHTLDTSWSW